MNKKLLIGFFCLTIFSLLLPTLVLAQSEIVNGLQVINKAEIGLTRADPRETAVKIINVALGFLGIIAVIIVLYGGFMWMTAGGNEERITKAKQILTAGVIGLVIIIMAWAIARFVVETLIEATKD
jgi:Zn-dependent protease with chaperone function